MSWMLGVRIDGEERLLGPPYRGVGAGSMRIEIRNPPVFSSCAALVGLVVFVVAFTLAFLPGDGWDLGLALRSFAPVVVGLGILGAGLTALFHPHTRLVIDARDLVVERAKHTGGARWPLLAIKGLQLEAATGAIRATTETGEVVLAEGLLPEQAALVRAAIERMLVAR